MSGDTRIRCDRNNLRPEPSGCGSCEFIGIIIGLRRTACNTRAASREYLSGGFIVYDAFGGPFRGVFFGCSRVLVAQAKAT